MWGRVYHRPLQFLESAGFTRGRLVLIAGGAGLAHANQNLACVSLKASHRLASGR